MRSSSVPSVVSLVMSPGARTPMRARPMYTAPRRTAAMPPATVVPRTSLPGVVKPRSRSEVMTTIPNTLADRTSMVR